MATCVICRFETELDDVVLGGRAGRCVCLRCFDRETGNGRSMPTRSPAMPRHHCPRCRGRLFFTAEDDLPRVACVMCGRGFIPAQARQTVAKAA